jgi:lysozyme
MSRLRNAGIGAAVATAIGIAAINLVGPWEGLRLNAYRDIVGVWTICYGETKGVKPGQKFTKEQCDGIFLDSLVEHEEGMRKCLRNPDAIPEKSYVAFVSLTYNIGVGGFCRSSLPAYINKGDIRTACNLLPAFNRAGGQVIQGLVNRRAAEQKLCLEGVR